MDLFSGPTNGVWEHHGQLWMRWCLFSFCLFFNYPPPKFNIAPEKWPYSVPLRNGPNIFYQENEPFRKQVGYKYSWNQLQDQVAEKTTSKPLNRYPHVAQHEHFEQIHLVIYILLLGCHVEYPLWNVLHVCIGWRFRVQSNGKGAIWWKARLENQVVPRVAGGHPTFGGPKTMRK